jgi:hypothetical protein
LKSKDLNFYLSAAKPLSQKNENCETEGSIFMFFEEQIWGALHKYKKIPSQRMGFQKNKN